MIALPTLLEHFPLRAGDAIHLSTAIWLKDRLQVGESTGKTVETVEFGVADKRLAEAALQYGMKVFDPEQQA